MANNGDSNGNGRVTNRDIFEAIENLRREVKSDIKEVREEVQCVDQKVEAATEGRAALRERVSALEVKCQTQSDKQRTWDLANSVAAAIAAGLAAIGIGTR